MKYKKLVHPELKHIAKKVPYNKVIITCANIFQIISANLVKVPKEIQHRSIRMEGYQRKNFKVEIFEPSNHKETLPCLVYVHGGAFSYKASAYHKKLAYMYAMQVPCRIFFPDYHLLPKYPYPAAYEDVLAVYRYLMENYEEYQIDIEKIGLAGDSAGAYIAASICNKHESEGLKAPCAQMLVYPLTDCEMRTDSMKKFSDTPIWNSKNNQRMWSYYCMKIGEKEAYNSSPMHTILSDRIPDTYIETAEYDCLHDEGILYGKRLQEAGANVEINETKGTFHGYDSAIHTNIAIHNMEKRISFLKNAFYGNASKE